MMSLQPVTRLLQAGFVFSIALLAFAAQPWTKDQAQWTASDVQRILGSSPWAQTTEAIFGIAARDEREPDPAATSRAATATMTGGRGATDGNWDGGVGRMQRGSPPSLPVAIRWESALPVRQALAKADSARQFPYADRAAKEYILSVKGLIAATRSGGSDPVDSQRMLEGVMTTSRMTFRGRVIRPDDAKIDANTGELALFFPRTEPIFEKDKEVRFDARYGSLSVTKLFKLKDMIYKGQLEL